MTCETYKVGGMDYEAVEVGDSTENDAQRGLRACAQCDLARKFRDCLSSPPCCPANGRTDGRTIAWKLRAQAAKGGTA